MNRRIAAALTLALLTFTTACGSSESGGESSGGDPTSTSSDATNDADPSTDAVSVMFHKSGGLRPVDERTFYSADAPPPAGKTQADVDDVLDAASNPDLRDVDAAPMPENVCCDRQEYMVTISYADGTSVTYRTIDGLQQPVVLERFLGML
jgi:hypothetical protein